MIVFLGVFILWEMNPPTPSMGMYEIKTSIVKEILCFTFRIHIHEGWNSRTVNNDFALLKLSSKIAFENYEHIRPICLPTIPRPQNETVSNVTNSSVNMDPTFKFRGIYCSICTILIVYRYKQKLFAIGHYYWLGSVKRIWEST